MKTVKGKEDKLDFYGLPLRGKYNNYVGVKFEKIPQKAGYFE